MNRHGLVIPILLASLVAATAQTPQQTPSSQPSGAASPPPASSGPGNNAVNTPSTTAPGAPVAGANSFTEGQATARIESQGFTNVTGLKKDDSGIWRGTATKDGKTLNVGLDFQGNVVAQ